MLAQALGTQDFERLADPRLERQYVDSEMFRMIEAAAACVRHSFIKRPKMGQVTNYYSKILSQIRNKHACTPSLALSIYFFSICMCCSGGEGIGHDGHHGFDKWDESRGERNVQPQNAVCRNPTVSKDGVRPSR